MLAHSFIQALHHDNYKSLLYAKPGLLSQQSQGVDHYLRSRSGGAMTLNGCFHLAHVSNICPAGRVPGAGGVAAAAEEQPLVLGEPHELGHLPGGRCCSHQCRLLSCRYHDRK